MNENQNLTQLLKNPAVREALRLQQEEQNQTALKARIALLDRIGATATEAASAATEAEAARKQFEKAQAAMSIERGKLGAAERKHSAARATLGTLERELRAYGEREVMDAEIVIGALHKRTEAQIVNLEGLTQPRIRNPLDPKDLERYQALLANQRAELPKITAAMRAATKLRHARLAPSVLIAEVNKLLASVGLDQGAMQ